MSAFLPAAESWLKKPRFDQDADPFELEARYQSLGDARSLEEKDRDKILYSPFLRRLGGVSQVVPSGMEQRIHNRLTHSLEVSQLARRIADIEKNSSAGQDLRLNPTVAETAGLAHDLGHAPFGHVGEEALDKLLASYRNPLCDLSDAAHLVGGYEGNAQTFRILSVLGVSNREGRLGLNLTRRTYLSVLKYPWSRPADSHSHSKFCFYSQADDVRARAELLGDQPAFRTPECEVMDYADDVVYSVIDASDFYRLGMIDLEAHSDQGRFRAFIQKAQSTPRSPFYGKKDSEIDWESLDRARGPLFDQAPPPYTGRSSVEREALQWMVNVMDYLTTSLTGNKADRPFSIQPYERRLYKGQEVYRCARRIPSANAALDVLKAMTWVYVINVSFDLEIMQRRAETMLSRLVWYFDLAMTRFREGKLHQRALFGPYIHLIERLDPSNRIEHVRLAADIVASMTDAEAEHHYRVLNLATFA